MKGSLTRCAAVISAEDHAIIKNQAARMAEARLPMGGLMLHRHLSELQSLQDEGRITYVAVWRLNHYGINPFIESKKENPDVVPMLPKSVIPVYYEMLSVLYLYALEYRKECRKRKLKTPKDIPPEFWDRAQRLKAEVIAE